MITSTELRIGNWVMPKENIENQEVGKVTQVYMNGFTVDYHYPGSWYKPIPLTPEILEKCGLVKTYESRHRTTFDADKYGHGEIGIVIYHIMYAGMYFRYYSEVKEIPCKYVHQLQNLYFALTGEELTVNL